MSLDLNGLWGIPLPHAWLRAGLAEAVERGYPASFFELYKSACVDLTLHSEDMDRFLERGSPGFAALSPRDRGRARLDRSWEYALRLHWTRSPTLVVRPSLVRRLHRTDIGLSVPGSMFSAPFPLCYLHFGRSDIVLPTGDSSASAAAWEVEGAFVQVIPLGEQRSVMIHAFGPTVGRAEGADGTVFVELGFGIESPELPLRNALVRNREKDGMSPWTCDLVDLVAKTFLYMNLREARLVEKRERSEALDTARGLPSKERRTHLRAARRLFAWIDVGPEEDDIDESLPSHSAKSMPPHVRRGHFHRYWTGQGRSSAVLRWIEPVVVNARRLAPGTPPPAARDYVVG